MIALFLDITSVISYTTLTNVLLIGEQFESLWLVDALSLFHNSLMNDVIGMSITEGIDIDIRISPMPKVCLAKNVSYTTT